MKKSFPLPWKRAIFSVLSLFLLVAGLVQPQASVRAAPLLTVTPITWDVVGLDSNNVNVGPNNFPVGVRVCNTGTDPATNVNATFIRRSPYITPIQIRVLPATACWTLARRGNTPAR